MNKDRSTGLRYPQAGLWEGDRSVRLWGILWGVPAFGLCLGNETDYFQPDWQSAFWGSNYARLLQVKRRYDPHGLFTVHHGVGSEGWSADSFTRSA